MEITELFKTVRVKFKDLVPNEINPRKIKEAKKHQLWERLNKYGMISIPTQDYDGKLLGGHRRCELYVMYGFGEQETDVRRAKRKLTPEEVREIMLIDNTNAGEFDQQMLHAEFAEFVDLGDFGLSVDEIISELKDLEDKAEAEEPEMPIVPKFSEKYEAFIIICRNEIDANHIAEKLGVDKAQSYKSESIGQSHVVDAEKVIGLWK